MSDNFMRTALLPTGAMTGNATITTQAFNMSKFAGCSFQPVWSGTPTGAFTVWVSNDYASSPALTNPAAPFSVGTWDNLGASVPTNPAGSAGSTFIPVYAACSYFMLLQYINASGAGVMSGYFAGKYRG